MIRKSAVRGPYELDFGRRVQDRRLAMRMNQAELAARIKEKLPPDSNFGRASISRYESGDTIPSSKVARALAESLNMPIDELLPAKPMNASRHQAFAVVSDTGNMVKILIDARVSFDAAVRIRAILAEENALE